MSCQRAEAAEEIVRLRKALADILDSAWEFEFEKRHSVDSATIDRAWDALSSTERSPAENIEGGAAMSVSIFEIWLQDYLEWAETKAAESYAVAPNSYGCGYDRGYADALIAVQNDGAVALTPAGGKTP